MAVNANLGQLLDQTFRLIQAVQVQVGNFWLHYINGTMTIGKLKTDMGRRKGRHLRNSAIQTQTKVVAAGSRNCALTYRIQDQGFVHLVGPKYLLFITCWIVGSISSSLPDRRSGLNPPASPPNILTNRVLTYDLPSTFSQI